MDIFNRLKDTVEYLHGVTVDVDVKNFLVDVESPARETLLVRENGDNVEIGLYISEDIMSRLRADDPYTQLHRGNLEEYCIALEGVSHLIFLMWRSEHGPVKLLDLELQAEVDKFASMWFMLAEQGTPLKASAFPLMERLFSNYTLCEGVDPVLYHDASRAASRYCKTLIVDYHAYRDKNRLLGSLRRFCRLELTDKLLPLVNQ